MKVDLKNNVLTITIDVSPKALSNAPLSKSGKSYLVASTNGFLEKGPVRISLNCITGSKNGS